MTGDSLNKSILTIDCGLSGGLAIWQPNKPIEVHKLGKTFDELTNQFMDYPDAFGFVESQQLRKFDTLTGRWLNIHKLCLHYQRIKDALECCQINYKDITAKEWQKPLSLKSKNYADRKKELKQIGMIKFPQLKVTKWNCDALLMMDYIKQKTPQI